MCAWQQSSLLTPSCDSVSLQIGLAGSGMRRPFPGLGCSPSLAPSPRAFRASW